MLKVELKDRSYEVVVGKGVFDQVMKDFVENGCKYAIIADSNVASIYGEKIVEQLKGFGGNVDLIIFEAGEKSKTWETAGEIAREMLRKSYSRSDVVIALGGGVTGDLAGFVASVFMRGIDVIQVPTSLLAMTDAAIGGKTGVNCPEGKNLLGSFHQPKVVCVDVEFLETLPKVEWQNGYAEIVKHAIINDEELMEMIEGAGDDELFGDLDFMVEVLRRSCGVKVEIVSKDEKESGLRMKLNLGHTLGHAIEREMNYEIAHGCAVSIGTMKICEVAVMKEMMDSEDADRVKEVFVKIGLPLEVPNGLSAEKLVEAMSGDKKVRKGEVNFVVPRKVGAVDVTTEVVAEDFLKVI